MPTNHDPPGAQQVKPGIPLTDDQVRMPRSERSPDLPNAWSVARTRAAQLASQSYRLLYAALLDIAHLDVDPLDLVADMANGRYRWRRRRDGSAEVDTDGQPVPEEMSFRAISEELARLTGEDVSHETLRRWWLKMWPDRPLPNQVTHAARAWRNEPKPDLQVTRAQRQAAAAQSNPDVPPATFHAPAG